MQKPTSGVENPGPKLRGLIIHRRLRKFSVKSSSGSKDKDGLANGQIANTGSDGNNVPGHFVTDYGWQVRHPFVYASTQKFIGLTHSKGCGTHQHFDGPND
tara:strand:- start:14768 stop:15070 length:303 start_codon:yes stop_codon:yes gene_type:complete